MPLLPRARALLLLVCASGAALATPAPRWTRVGPDTGTFIAVEFAPGSATAAIAVSDQGVFRSSDGGATWALATAAYYSTYGLAHDPSDPQRVYVGARDVQGRAGMLVSTDGGATFVLRTAGISELALSELAVSRDGTKVYFGGLNEGVYASADHGATWAARSSGLPLRDGGPWIDSITALAVDAGGADVLYAGTASGAWRSSDGGGAWVQRYSGQVRAIATHPAIAGVVHLAGPAGVQRTVDGGITWSVAALADRRIVSIAVDPGQPARVHALDDHGQVHLSVDGGGTWSANGTGAPPAASASLGSIAVSGADGDRLLIATLQGLFRSVDGGTRWSASSVGARAADVVSLHPAPGVPGRWYSATRWDGVWRSDDAGSSHQRADAGLQPPACCGGAQVQALSISPADPARMLAGVLDDPADGLQGLFASSDGGASWIAAGGPALGGRWVDALAHAPSDPSRVYAHGAANSLGRMYRSDDGGATWTALGTGLPADSSVADIEVAPADPDLVLVATRNHGAYRSSDGGASWTALATASWVSAIRYDPWHPGELLLASNGGLQRSVDHGSTLTDVATTLAGDGFLGTSIGFHPTRPNSLVLGTSSGAWVSHDRGASWHALGNFEVPMYMVNDAHFDGLATTTDRLLLAVAGRGVFVYNAYSPLSVWSLRPHATVAVRPGATVEAWTNVANSGTDAAPEVVATVTFPAGFTATTVSASGASCTASGTVHVCRWSSLAAGALARLDLSATAGGPGEVQVVVTSPTDATAGDDAAVLTVTTNAGQGGGALGLELLGLLLLALARIGRRALGAARGAATAPV